MKRHGARQSNPTRATLVGFVALTLTVWITIEEATAQGYRIELSEPKLATAPALLTADGTTNLPEGTVLEASVWFGGSPQLFQSVDVREGGFPVKFGPLPASVLCGDYLLQVECHLNDQSPSLRDLLSARGLLPKAQRSMRVGDLSEAQKDRREVRDQLRQILEGLRMGYRYGLTYSSYTIARTQGGPENNRQGKLPAEAKNRIHREWQSYFETNWAPVYQNALRSFQEHHQKLFLCPFPGADREVESLLSLLPRWAAAVHADVCIALEVPVPAEVAEVATFDGATMTRQILRAGRQAFQLLRLRPGDWRMMDMGRLETGTIQGQIYRSATTNFAVAKPGDAWVFAYPRVGPSLRLRILPRDPEQAKQVRIAVEILDYRWAKNWKDLASIVETAVEKRWQSYEKVSSQPIGNTNPPGTTEGNVQPSPSLDAASSDATNPTDARRGLRIVFDTQSSEQKHRVLQYTLFGGRAKRAYSVVCMAPQEKFEAFKKDFDKACDSFRILPRRNPAGRAPQGKAMEGSPSGQPPQEGKE